MQNPIKNKPCHIEIILVLISKLARSGPPEPANSARRGHPRTVPHAKMSSKGRTELKISLSRSKNRFFGIFAVFLRSYEKTDVTSNFLAIFVRFLTSYAKMDVTSNFLAIFRSR